MNSKFSEIKTKTEQPQRRRLKPRQNPLPRMGRTRIRQKSARDKARGWNPNRIPAEQYSIKNSILVAMKKKRGASSRQQGEKIKPIKGF